MNRAEVERRLELAVAQLGRSERGDRIGKQLLTFIEGDFAGADMTNRHAVIDIMMVVSAGYFMSARDALMQGGGN